MREQVLKKTHHISAWIQYQPITIVEITRKIDCLSTAKTAPSVQPENSSNRKGKEGKGMNAYVTNKEFAYTFVDG